MYVIVRIEVNDFEKIVSYMGAFDDISKAREAMSFLLNEASLTYEEIGYEPEVTVNDYNGDVTAMPDEPDGIQVYIFDTDDGDEVPWKYSTY